MSRSRILFLNSRSELGGADFCLLETIRYLDKSRLEPLVGLPGPGPLVDALIDAGAKVLFFDVRPMERPEGLLDLFKFGAGFIPAALKLARVLRREKVDLVYTNSSAIQIGALAARLCGVPNVWHVREIWITPKWLVRGLNRYIYTMADHVIAISQAVANHNFGSDRSHKVTVLYDGIDLSMYTNPHMDVSLNSLGLSPTRPVIGMVTRLVPWKGTHLLLDATGDLVHQGYEFNVLIVGDIPRPIYSSYKQDLLRQVEKLGLDGRVAFVGWQEHASSYLHQMDILALPSVRPEPFGRVILEAWAAGKPVIASAHGGPVEVIQHKQNGMFFQPNDSKDLARQMAFLLDCEEQRQAMGEAGQREVQKRFDVKQSTEQIQELCYSLVHS